MKNNMFLVSLFAITLFIFGCTLPGGQSSTTPTPSPQPTPSPTPVTQPSPTPQPTPAPTPLPIPQPSPISDFANKGYEELVALGVPVECDVKITSSEGQQTMKLYVKGKTFRTEMDSPQTPECKKSVSIFKDLDAIYIGCEKEEILPQCKWLKIGLDVGSVGGAQPTSSSSTMSSSDLEEIPKTDFSCKAGTFTDAVFVAGGKVCDLSELTKGLDTGGLDYGSALPTSDSNAGSSGETSDSSSDSAPPVPE